MTNRATLDDWLTRSEALLADGWTIHPGNHGALRLTIDATDESRSYRDDQLVVEQAVAAAMQVNAGLRPPPFPDPASSHSRFAHVMARLRNWLEGTP